MVGTDACSLTHTHTLTLTLSLFPRDAYNVALAPHHPWLIRSAAELVFVALPDRRVFLDIVCVRKEEDVGPVLNVVVDVMREVYTRTQSILEEHNMMELP